MRADEDLSEPYESWSTAPLDVIKTKRKRVRTVLSTALIGGALAIGALTAWILVLNRLAPVWRRLPDSVFLIPVVLAVLGTALLHFSLRNRWHPRMTLSMGGLLLMLPAASMPLWPLVLYANQALDLSTPTCSVYTVAKKTKVRRARGGPAHEVALSSDGQVVTAIRVSEQQFMSVSEGQAVWIEVAEGLFGIKYVNRFDSSEMSCADASHRV
ncbi:hypothetical protein [Roseateles sp. P5_E4]